MRSVSPEGKGIGRLAGAVWARRGLVLASTLIFAGAAFAIATLIGPTYRADVQILVEPRETASADAAVEAGGPSDPSGADSLESQIPVIASPEILALVAERFKLAALPEYSGSGGLLGRLLPSLSSGADSSPAGIVTAIRGKLDVHRMANQRVLVVAFSSRDPALARDVPNAIAAEYLSRQKGALASSGDGARGWLEQEIADLRQAVKTAEGKVAAFRATSDLLSGDGRSALAARQLPGIATELSEARTSRIEAEGRAETIRKALERGRSLDAASQALSSPTMATLRERQAALKSEIADLSTTLLDGHPRIRSLRAQLRDLDAEIAREARVMQSSLEADAEAARQREATLGAEMERLKAETAEAGNQEVELRALEREAQSENQLLETYLARHREAVARGSRDYLPVEARLFSEAELPTAPVFPRKLPITAAAGLAGFLFAVLAILAHALFIGRAAQVPPVAGRWVADAAAPDPVGAATAAPEPMTVAVPATAAAAAVQTGRTGTGVAELGEAIVASEIARILVVPAHVGGRSASVALARQLASRERSTILVDLSETNAAARAMGVPFDAEGAGDLVDGTSSFADVIHRDLLTSAHVLPSAGFATIGGGIDAAEEIGVVLEALGKAYDCTMVDCGAMSEETLARLMDGDAALVVSVEPGEEADGEAKLRRLSDAGLGDIVLMHLDAPGDAEGTPQAA